MHANAPREVPARLEALGLVAGLTRAGVHAQAAAALDAVLHLRREGRRREVVEIAHVERDAAGQLVVLPALRRGEVVPGPGWPGLAGRLGLT